MLVGGYGLTGTWFVAGALGIPRRYAVQPAGTAHYSLVGAIFALVLAAGFLVLLGELAWLAVAPSRWPTSSRPSRLPPAPWARNDDITLRRYSSVRLRPPLATPGQLAAAATLALISLGAFLPAVIDYSETSVRSHHLDHTVMFLLGCLLGLSWAARGFSRSPTCRRTEARWPSPCSPRRRCWSR